MWEGGRKESDNYHDPKCYMGMPKPCLQKKSQKKDSENKKTPEKEDTVKRKQTVKTNIVMKCVRILTAMKTGKQDC